MTITKTQPVSGDTETEIGRKLTKVQSWVWEGGEGRGEGTELRREDGEAQPDFVKVGTEEQDGRGLVSDD